MRPTLLFLTCALVLPVQPLCHGQESAPPKESFWKRLFHRSGSSQAQGEVETPQYHPYPKNPLILHDSGSGTGSGSGNLPPPAYPPAQPPMKHSFFWAHKTGDIFRTLGSWLTFKGRPDLQDSVASVHMSFLGIRPWNDLKKDLETNFTLDAATALTKVVPIVGASVESVVDVNSASLRVAGPAAPNAPALTGAPAAPTSLIPSTDLSAVLTPPTSVTVRNSGGIALDPFLQYRTAQSLLQNVTLLNNTISSAPLNDKYDPYVVTLQVTLMPHRRDGAYDVYTDITFVDGADHYDADAAELTAAKQGAGLVGDPASLLNTSSALVPRVIPLLVTDDLEAVSSSHASRKINQLTAALAAAAPQISGAGSYQKYTDTIDKFIGEETNALVTVARLQENVFRVRFGANVQAGKKRFSIVPQAHKVYLLLLYPKGAVSEIDAETGKSTSRYYSCNAIAMTHMREADTGRLLRRPRPTDVGRAFYEAVKPFRDARIFTYQIYREDNVLELSNYVRLNEYKNFQAKAQTLLNPVITWTMAQQFVSSASFGHTRDPKDYRLRNDALVMSLWSSLSQIFGRSVYSADNIVFNPPKEAPVPPLPKYDNDHLTSVEVLLLDDGDTITGALDGVQSVSAANASKIDAWLEYPDRKDKLFAKNITPDASSNLVLEFDSLKKYGLNPPDVKLMLAIAGKTDADKKIIPVPVKYLQPKPPEKQLKAQLLAHLSSSSQTITKKADGTGTYTFSVKVAPQGKINPKTPDVKPAYKNYVVTVKGAGLVTQPPAAVLAGSLIDPAGKIDPATGKIDTTMSGDGVFKVPGDTLVTLALQNFNVDNKITISLDAGDLLDPAAHAGDITATDLLEVQVVPAGATAAK